MSYIGPIQPRTYLENLCDALHQIFEKDERVILIGEDILDPYGGAFKVTKGLSTKFPGRVITTPICEASIVGVGIGFALRGFKPIIEIMFGDFVTIAADQIVNHAVKFEPMYGWNVKVPIVVRLPVGGGRGYGPTHSQSLEKMFLGIPNLDIVAPSHFHDPALEIRNAVKNERPVLFLENKTLYPLPVKTLLKELYIEEINSLPSNYNTVMIRNFPSQETNPDVIVVTYGGISQFLEKVLKKFIEEEIWVLAILPSYISNPPYDIIIPYVENVGRVVIIEEGPIGFGWCSEIASKLYTLLFNKLKSPVACLGAEPTIIPSCYELESQIMVNEVKIEQTILGVLE